MDSILGTVKKALGLDTDFVIFDATIITNINTVLATLNLLGVGPTPAFVITGTAETWTDFLPDLPSTTSIQTYVINEVRKVFDPFKLSETNDDPNSIFNTVKKLLGIESDFDGFDIDILTDINAVLMTLNQLGVGPENAFAITGKTETWSQLTGIATNLEGVKTYVFLKTKLLFDPPTLSTVLDALDRQAKELEWRLTTMAESNLLPPVVEEVPCEEDIWE